MTKEKPQRTPPTCPHCRGPLEFTGLPDVSGPVYFRLFNCTQCGVIRIDVEPEDAVGWG